MALGGLPADEALEAVRQAGGEPGPFAARLLAILEGRESEWDEKFEPFLAEGWPLSRLSWTDRVSLRLACCELWEVPEVPPKVTIAEYVALAKTFGAPDSGRFVNGVLASVLPISPKAKGAVPVHPLSDVERLGREEPGPMNEPGPEPPRWVLRTED
jgi:transcription antitermination factor NusB